MLEFQNVCGRKIVTSFNGGNLSSDGGLLLLSELDRKLGFSREAGQCLNAFDERDSGKVQHSYSQMYRQRVYGLCCGYEDLTDHTDLNRDLLFQTSLGRDVASASPSTLSRFENCATREMCVEINKGFVESFIENQSGVPDELILDFDATDDRLHGDQEGKFFHGYYGHYCYLPLYVFCGESLLCAYLRPSNIDGALHSWAILSLLVKRFRQEWPGVRIIFRGDSGFCRHPMLRWCENKKVDYIVGLGRNKVLEAQSSRLLIKTRKQFNRTGQASKLFCETYYAAKSWVYGGQTAKRRVICKAEFNSIGKNQRYVVTNMKGDPAELYQNVYCARGDMENRLKEQQLGLFADRTSCQSFWSKHFRMLLSASAYRIMQAFRQRALKGTAMAKAQATTIREKLIKVATVIRRNTRRVYISFASSFPRQDIFKAVMTKINAIS